MPAKMGSKHHLAHVCSGWVFLQLLLLLLLFNITNGQDDSTPVPIGQHQIHWCEFNSTFAQSNPAVCRQIRQDTGLNNVVFADLDDCRSYYQCTGNRLHHRRCTNGTLFDSRHYYCADQVDAQCLTANCDGVIGAPSYCHRPLPCTPGDKVPDLSRSCRFYFECVVDGDSQEWKAKICSSRIGPMLFDPVSQSCKRPGTVVCPEPCPETTATEQETTPFGAISASETVTTTHEEMITSIITDSTSWETTTGQQETTSSSDQPIPESTSLSTTLFKFSTAQSTQSSSTEVPSTQDPVTKAIMPSSSVCERQLPCTLDEILPDPENCNFYYKCSAVPGSLQLQTHWYHTRCVSKVGHTQFDSISWICMHVDEEPVCALPCPTTSSSDRTTELPEVVSTQKNKPGDATTQTLTFHPATAPVEITTSKDIQTTTMAFGELSTVSKGESTSASVYVTDKTFAQSTSNSQCIGKELLAVLDKLDRLSDGIGVSSDVLNNICQTMNNITSFRLHPCDIMASVDILKRIEKIHEVYTDVKMSTDEMQAFLDTISNLLSEQNHKSWKALQDDDSGDTAQAILPIMDACISIAVRDISTNETFMSDYLLLQLESFPKLSARTVSFPRKPMLPMPWMINENDVITLQKETFDNLPQDIISGNTYSLSSMYYKDVSSVLPSKLVGKMDEEGKSGGKVANKLNSRVLSLTLHGLPSFTRLQPNVTISFSLTESYESHTALCAFWNDGYEGGGWDTEGCQLVSLFEQQVTCQCNHLTNFAILMSPNPANDEHHFILSIISIAGCVVSIVFMVLTILIYIAIWKHMKSHHAVVVINLCIALIVANVFFVSAVDKTDIPVMCTIIAVVLHYFYLSAFFIMLVEGIELLFYTIFIFHARRKCETATLLFLAWTLPAVIVGICLGITKLKGYGNDRFCWLDIKSGLLWAFVGPALVIIFINVIIAIAVIKRLATGRVLGSMQKKNHKIRSGVRNLLVIMPVMGLAWVFGVFTVNDGLHNHIFQYIFVAANSLQGLFIFIFHALCNKKRKNASRLSNKSQRSRLKSDSSGKSKKSKLSNSSKPSSLLDENVKLTNGNPNKNSLPGYNFSLPRVQLAGNIEEPSVPGTHTIGNVNPTFSTFSGDRKHMHSDLVDPITKMGKDSNVESTQELHYVEEVTYQIKPDSRFKPRASGAHWAEARLPLTYSSSNNSNTS